ncbi:zinc ribbon domain-containing protein [Deinococcus hohokamensis]|uniref:Zinc ribbon domain-containing protein n=1 Tax=Deinococcus hohokamensis TaxID=309883 RepID=A0ABV9I617_9DEIO
MAGIPFTRVEAAGTSTTCPRPGCRYRHASNRHGRLFVCQKCGYKNNADIVGATNVLTTGIAQDA